MKATGRILSILMSIVLVMGLMPLPAFAGDSLEAANAVSVGVQAASYNNKPASILTGKDKKGAYAVLYEDGQMLMQRGNTNKRSGVDVVAVYEGLESDYWNLVEYLPGAVAQKSEVREYFTDYKGCIAYTQTGRYERDWWAEAGRIESVRVVDKIRPQSVYEWFYGCANLVSADLALLDVTGTVDRAYLKKFQDQYITFDGCHLLETVVLGAKCRRDVFQLPVPDPQYIFGADGKWYDESGVGYEPNKVPSGVASTYRAYPANQSVIDKSSELDGSDDAGDYAVMYQDGEMLLQKGNALNQKRASAGKIVTDYFQFSQADLDGGNVPWSRYRSFVTSVTMGVKLTPKSMEGWFSDCCRLRTVDFGELDSRSVTSMRELFGGCWHLNDVDLSKLNVASVEDMGVMFGGCGRMKSIDLSGFRAPALKDASQMFFRMRILEIREFDGAVFFSNNGHARDVRLLFCFNVCEFIQP